MRRPTICYERKDYQKLIKTQNGDLLTGLITAIVPCRFKDECPKYTDINPAFGAMSVTVFNKCRIYKNYCKKYSIDPTTEKHEIIQE